MSSGASSVLGRGHPGDSSSRPVISVCILAGHGPVALDRCLRSLRQQESAPPFELLIGGTPAPEALAVVRRHFPAATVCETGRLLLGAARNRLIERARGELLLFLDDDVTVPPELLRRLADTARRYPEASVFGGPNETPPGSGSFQVVQGAVLSSLMGAGPVSRRYGARRPGPADERWFTLCNLAVRRNAMLPFLSCLAGAEENALLAALRRGGQRMRYEPSLRAFHTRRPGLGSLARQMLKYGRGRGELTRRHPGTVRAAYLAPTAFLVYLLLLPAIAAWGGQPLLALTPLAIYAALVTATGLRIGWTLRRFAAAPLATALIPLVHLCYGAGVPLGLCRPSTSPEEAASRAPATQAAVPSSSSGSVPSADLS
jgi:hypothetical protein